jgi:hypothetical protein
MKKSYLILTVMSLALAGSSLIARDFGGGGRDEGGGYRNSAEFENSARAGGRPGTYNQGAQGYEHAYDRGMNQGYNEGSYNNSGSGTNIYVQPTQPMGPQINPDQMPY